MSTIDERVVELQFNNAQFEAGVQTSINTLERLKAGLNLEGAAKGLEGLSTAGKTFSLANVADNVQTVADRFSVLGIIGDQVLRRITDSAIGMGKKLLTAIPNQMITGGKARAQNIEAAKFQIQGLKESWDDLYSSMDKAVSGTAYGIDAAAKAASQLVASNVAVGTEMDKALRGISGVAAMTNSTYEDIARVFTTVAGNGRLMGDQLNQLSSRGLNVAATLAEALNKSEQEIREMVSRGKIDFKTFAEAMDDAFGEHATKANKTFTGALSNIKASLSRMGQKFAAPTFDALRDVFNDLLPVMKRVEKIIQPIADKYSAFIKSATVATSGLLRQVGDVIGVDWADIDLSRAKAAKEEAKEIEEIAKMSKERHEARVKEAKSAKESAETIREEEKQLKEAEERYTKATQDRIDKEAEYQKLQKETGEEAKKTADQLDKATDKAKDSAKKADIVRTTLNKLGEPGNRILSVYDTLNGKVNAAAQTVSDLSGNFLSLIGIEKDTTEAAEEAAESVMTVDDLANDVIKGLYGNGEERKKALDDLGLSYSIIQNRVNELLGCEKRHAVTEEDEAKMAKYLAGANKEVVETQEKELTTGDKLRNIFLGIGSAMRIAASFGKALFKHVLLPFGKWVGSGIANAALTAFNFLGEKLQALEAALPTDAFDKFFSSIADFAKNVKTNVTTIATTISKLQGVKALAASLKAVGTAVKNFASAGWQKVTGFFSNFSKSVKGFDNGKFMGLYATINNVTLALSNFINRTLSGEGPLFSLFSFFREAFSSLKESVPGVFNQFTAFFNSIKDIKIVTKIRDAFKGLSDSIGSIHLPKLSKLKNMLDSLTPHAKDFFDAFSKGNSGLSGWYEKLLKDDPKATRVVALAKKKVQKAITNIFAVKNAIKDAASNIWSTISGLFDTIKEKLPGKVSDLWDTIKKIVGNITVDDLTKVAKLALTLMALFRAFKFMGSLTRLTDSVSKVLKNFSKTMSAYSTDIRADAIRKIAISIAILAAALIALSFVPKDQLNDALEILAKLAIGLVAVYAAIEFIGSKLKKTSTGEKSWLSPIADSLNGVLDAANKLLKSARLAVFGAGLMLIATGLVAIAGALKTISKLDVKALSKNLEAFVVVFGVFGAMVLAAKYAGTGAASLGTSVLAMAYALKILVGVFQDISAIEIDDLTALRTLGIMVTLIAALSGAVSAGSAFAGANVKGFGLAMIEVAAAMWIVAKAFNMISSIDGDALYRSTLALGGTIGALAALVSQMSNMENISTKGILALAVVIGVIGLALWKLSDIPVEKLGPAAASLAGIVLSLAGAVKAMEKISWKTALAGALAMAAVLGAVVGAFYLIDRFDISVQLDTAKAMALVILSLAATIWVLQKVDWKGGAAAAGALLSFIGIITAALFLVGGLVNALGAKEDVLDAINGGAEILSAVAKALGGAIGDFIGALSAGIKTGGLEKQVDNFTAFLGKLEPFYTAVNAIPEGIGTKLSDLSTGLTELFKTNLFQNNKITTALLGGGSNLSAFSTQFKEVGQGLSDMADQVSKIKEEDFAKLEPAIKAINDLASIKIDNSKGLISALTGDNQLKDFTASLANVGGNIGAFASSVSGVDFSNCTTAAEEIARLASIEIDNSGGFISWLTGDNQLKDFTESLYKVGGNIGAFASSVQGVDFSSCSAAATAIAELSAIEINNSGGFISWIMGDNQLDDFTESLYKVGSNIGAFASAVNGVDFSNCAEAANQIATLAAIDIPNSGGLLSWIMGDNQLSDFTAKLANVGGNIGAFASSVSGVDFSNCTAAATAIAELAGVEVDKTGGLWQKLTGENGMGAFAKSLQQMGSALKFYVSLVGGVTAESVAGSVAAVTEIVGIAEKFENKSMGDVLADLFGIDEVSKFTDLSNALKTLAEGVKELTGANLSTATKDLEKLITAAAGTAGAQFTGLEDLAADLIDFADSLGVKKFKEALEGSDTTSGIMDAARGLISAAVSGLSEGTESLTTECTAIVNSAVAVFTNATSQFSAAGLANGAFYARGLLQATSLVSAAARSLVTAAKLQLDRTSDATKAGHNFGDAFADAIEDKESDAKTAGDTIGDAAYTGLTGSDATSSNAKKVGADFGDGFVAGVRSKGDAAYRAGLYLRNQAKKGAGDPGDIDPGDGFKPEGEAYGISFALGLYSAASEVVSASENLSRTVTETLANPLKIVQKVLDSEIDPEITIKPVLDLSDIQNGAKTLNKLIPAGATTVGSINVTPVNASRASNDDVIAAIKSLADSLPDGGDTYVIEGITYDDGSYVADAVRTLVRAAKVQRRA